MKRKSLSGRRRMGPSPEKAGKMLHDNSAQGHPLTGKQKKFFRAVEHGFKPTRLGGKKRPHA